MSVEPPPIASRTSLRLGGVVALFAGLALLIGLVAWVGWRPVWASASAVGWVGFAIICGYWLVILAVLGLAWSAGTLDLPLGEAAWPFIWGRLVREGAADVLPFSQVGGLVLGSQSVMAMGVSETKVFAATVVDLTTEMGAQIAYTLIGVGILAFALSGAGQEMKAVWIGLGALALIAGATAAFIALQRRGIGALGWLAQRFLPDGAARGEAVVAELGRVYDSPRHLATASSLHLIGWFGASVGSWIALKLMGAPLPLSSVIAVESLMFIARSVGFAVPGALGVQEGAYLLAGPLLGLHGETAVALSLLKRARDLCIGIPTLIAWQVVESRRLLRRPPPSPADADVPAAPRSPRP